MQTKRQCNRIFNYIKKKGKTIYQPGILYQPEIPFKKRKNNTFSYTQKLREFIARKPAQQERKIFRYRQFVSN
jgi:hypothetical protein